MRVFIIAVLLDVALIVPVTSVGSSMGGELVTGFYLNTTEVDEDTYLVVANTGPLPATGVVLSGSVGGPSLPSDRHDCPEGNVDVNGDRILATFDRMTPNYQCMLASVHPDADLSSVGITADGYTTVWTKAGAEYMDALWGVMTTWPGALIPAFVIWNIILIAYILISAKDMAIKLAYQCRRFKWWLRDRDRKKLPLANNVADFMHREYGIADDKDIAGVVIVIMCGKDTLGQIKRHTGMASGRVMYILRLLRDKEIVSREGITLAGSLRGRLMDHTENLCECLEHETLDIGTGKGGVHHVEGAAATSATDDDAGKSRV